MATHSRRGLTAFTFLAATVITWAAMAEVARYSPFGGPTTAPGWPEEPAPEARAGGQLKLGSTQTFDSTNLMRFPGRSPNELQNVFDSLMVRSRTEYATYYGLLAREITVSEDETLVRFALDPRARWHDGTALTAHDVAFTIRALAAHGFPFQRKALSGVEIRVIDAWTIEFRNPDAPSWHYIEMIGTFPVQSSSFWSERDVGQATMEKPLGSGPYRLVALSADGLVLERAETYWAQAHPLTCGRWHFDRVSFDRYFSKATVIEALKRQTLDLVAETEARHWLTGYAGPALRSGALTRTSLPDAGAGRLNAMVLNTRRPPLDDPRVREALALVFDAARIRSLQGETHRLPDSLYGDTVFAAQGSASPAERALLLPFQGDFMEELLATPAPSVPLRKRDRLRRAGALLDAAGYDVLGQWRHNPRTNKPFKLVYVTAHPPTLDVVAPYQQWLAELGVQLEIEVTDLVSGRNRILSHAYDLTWLTWIPDIPPGADARLYWHSSQAGDLGYGLAGVNEPAIDQMIDIMTRSRRIETTQAAARAFDRLVRWGHYMIPISHQDEHWVVHDTGLAIPKTPGVSTSVIEAWWWADQTRRAALPERRWQRAQCGRAGSSTSLPATR